MPEVAKGCGLKRLKCCFTKQTGTRSGKGKRGKTLDKGDGLPEEYTSRVEKGGLTRGRGVIEIPKQKTRYQGRTGRKGAPDSTDNG